MNGFWSVVNALWHAFEIWIVKDQTGVEAVLVALWVSFIFSWPEKVPTSIQEVWTWARDTFQGAVPLKFTKPSTPPVHLPGAPIKPASDAPPPAS